MSSTTSSRLWKHDDRPNYAEERTPFSRSHAFSLSSFRFIVPAVAGSGILAANSVSFDSIGPQLKLLESMRNSAQ